MKCTCTQCLCEWDESGFYWYKGKVQQPCRECRLNNASVYRLNHRDKLNDAWRARYYENHEAMKVYYRTRQANIRAES